MITTFGTSMLLLLSSIALVLGVGLLDSTYKIFRRWKKSDLEEKYELEKEFYLVLAAACIVLMIRLTIVPLYFLTLQSLIPAIPGAMCLWGVFSVLPQFMWPALILKFLMPTLYGGWLVLALANSKCRRNQLAGTLAGLFILIAPFLLMDSVLDLIVLTKLTPIQVSCCSSVIDVGPRPIPPLIGTLNGQSVLILLFVAISALFITTSFLGARKSSLEWPARILAIFLVPLTILTMTEVLTPWILHLPFHYCPFCLLSSSVPAILFVSLLWVAISASWWTFITRRLGRVDVETKNVERELSSRLWNIAGSSGLVGFLVIIVTLVASFA
jgi:hypothetical protein